ncbi:ATP-dependent helicase/nuclease subunit A [Lactobacillus colini]|uniref:ATP-dependent helicase/nuclease subunit A n=1 Tax=Lactobacillus colini TaxID=1819254 RepID=A0ABS4MCF7_9LACO|nr:helicase-exonuclease AddAB subunit AddA [Lactobacillus colini]MBP2057079.1 ATP-dependent helicase/nuclease subunit A [Lactobacillus colini]
MVEFTKQQQQAIDDRGKDILVSASAGSGKTAVLVERVIKKVLSGTPVSNLLIITFTKAAASEMKEKIKLRLNKQLDKDPNNNFLRTQLIEVDTANISTIDSFCLDVIRRFYYVIDLDPSFSVLTDETQAALMKEKALKDIQDEYLEKNDQNFLAFYDNFAGDREADEVHQLLLDLYDVTMTQPDYVNYLQNIANFYDLGKYLTESNLWNSYIKVLLLQKFKKINTKVLDLIGQAQKQSQNFSKVITQLTEFNDHLEYFIGLLKNDAPYNDLRNSFQKLIFKPARKTGKKSDDNYEEVTKINEYIKQFREATKEELIDLYGQYFVIDEKQQLDSLSKAYQIIQTASEVERKFIEKFNELKRQQNFIDYQDMEQFANKILTQDTSNSNLAKKYYQEKFDEILIDEYQDVNYLQESIIQSIKKKGQNTLFMVGDVKQSIYGFRQAQPDLFLQKYHDFKDNDNSRERIILADNFRSSQAVVDFVNKAFDAILTSDFGGINYKQEARLIHGAQFDRQNTLGIATELLFSRKKNQKDSTFSEDKIDDINQTKMIIERIKQLKNEEFKVWDDKENCLRPFRYSDIAILTRTHSDNLQVMQEFAKADIPLFVTDAQNYFQTFELVMIMNYLRIIDNPRQDIPLVAVLRSPIYGFTEPELAKIRVNSKNTDFFDAVVKYSTIDSELGKKCKKFLNQLEEFRQFATNHRISELIWSIYEITHLLEIFTGLPNGQQRRVNLQALYERASSYESAGFKGLYQFINFIERMRKNNKDLAQPLLSDQADNSVKLMTIHGSKGLEFPIVFVMDLNHRYQKRDLQGDYIISPKLGLGISIREEKYKIDTLVKSIIKYEKKQELLEEEARILYVALTRARQKLIMVASLQDREVETNFSSDLDIVDKLSAQSSWSFLKHQLNVSGHTKQKISEMNLELDKVNKVFYIEYLPEETNNADKINESSHSTEANNYIVDQVKKLYEFSYPFADATKTTAYQAVSEIKSAFNDPLDEELKNSHLIPSTNRYLQPIDDTPIFLKENSFTGAEIGTATHLLLQYYDYRGSKDKNNLKNEIRKLITIQKLNPDIVTYLNQDAINWFVMSDFAKLFWKNPDKLHRESEFSSLVGVKQIFGQFSDPADKILVHGTIDGYYEDNDGIILFDYKTDYVDKRHLDQSIEKIKQKYTGQLRLYEMALNEMKDLKVKSKYLVLLDAKKLVKLD